MSEIFNRIDSLMKEQKKQYKELNDYLKLGKKTYDNWKNNRSSTYLKYLNEISSFLNVTPNYLLNGIDDSKELTSALEIELLQLFRSLEEKNQRWLLDVVKKMICGVQPA